MSIKDAEDEAVAHNWKEWSKAGSVLGLVIMEIGNLFLICFGVVFVTMWSQVVTKRQKGRP